MLVGPSITLKKLEESMSDRLYEINMELPKLKREFSRLTEEFQSIPRLARDKNGEEIINPEFTSLPEKMKEIEAEINELLDQQQSIEHSLGELDSIEERSKGRGNIEKDKMKITLTLNDCIRLGITTEEAPTE